MSRPRWSLRGPAADRELSQRIARLSIPALGTLAAEPLYVLVDTAIVGRLGTTELAGLAIAATILLTATSLFTFLEYGVTPDVAYAHGAGRPDDARRAGGDAVTLAMLLGVPLAILLVAAAEPLVWLLGGRGEVADVAVLYLRISTVGLPFILLTLVGHGVMRGVNQLRIPMVIVIVGNLVNLVLELIAVYVMDLGIAGSAWTTVFAQIGTALVFLRVLQPHRRYARPAWSRFRPVLVTGVHLGVRSLAMFAVWNTSTAVAARIDTPTLAAHQVLTQLFVFLALALDALAIPAQSLVAGELGAGSVPRAARVGWVSTRLSSRAGTAIAVVLAVGSPVIPLAFTADEAVQARITAGLLILAVMQFPGAIAFALDGALIGAHDERFLARQAVYNLAGYTPLAIATLLYPQLGLMGLWGAELIWMVIRAVANHRRWQSERWAAPRITAMGSTPAALA